MKIRIGKIILEDIEILGDESVGAIYEANSTTTKVKQYLDCEGNPIIVGSSNYTIDSENQTPQTDRILFDKSIDGISAIVLMNCVEEGMSIVKIRDGEKERAIQVESHWLTPINTK